jgi:hypothetical protein
MTSECDFSGHSYIHNEDITEEMGIADINAILKPVKKKTKKEKNRTFGKSA